MAQVGQWADHRELAEALVARVRMAGSADALIIAKDAAAALHDLGDRLDLTEKEKEFAADLFETATINARRVAFEKCARLAEEEAAKWHPDTLVQQGYYDLAAKYRQLAEKEAGPGQSGPEPI